MAGRHRGILSVYFDRRDHDLLNIVNGIVSGRQSRFEIQRQFFHFFHPRGIKEMAESRGLRIAYAVIHLLQSLESAQALHRLNALRALRDEVLSGTNQDLQMNTARVLIEIMKDLVRAHDDYVQQLEHAHNFRMAASGKPRIVRYFLKKYRLLELPEQWNHLAFDDHVHDAFTKGRKSPTHLIMDAWIKGIRRLRVIHYNYIRPETASELMEAASTMGIMIRIGIEFFASFHDRYAQLIWVPRGFADHHDFLRFLEKEDVRALMEEGKKVSFYQRNQVLETLKTFNKTHRHTLNSEFDLNIQPLDPDAFIEFVGQGQASLLHLAKYIHQLLLPLMREKVRELRELYPGAQKDQRRLIEALVDRMNRMDADDIHHRFLAPGRNPAEVDNHKNDTENPLPSLMQMSPCDLVDRLSRMHSAYRITLNLSNMLVEDVIELLYECRGRITRLEIFNLKDFADCKVDHIPDIDRLQQCINNANVIQLKRLILEVIYKLHNKNDPMARLRIQKLNWILADMETLLSMYRVRPLKSRIGSDSTGYSPRLPGMGLAVMDSLPRRAIKQVHKDEAGAYMVIPFYVETFFRLVYGPAKKNKSIFSIPMTFLRLIPGLGRTGLMRSQEWFAREESTKMSENGNIVTLSGFKTETNNGLYINKPGKPRKQRHFFKFQYLRTDLKNSLKVLFGFVPAFFTFYLTNDWWVLAYFGALIWFGITGLRNILQSVMAGGGLRRSPLLQWNDYISWERITDSLMFTGFSVPLLDYFVKTLMLKNGLGITTSTHPVFLYTVMAMVNGAYLTSHNLFRGLPREAAFANFFRSVLSIPVAFGLSELLGVMLAFSGSLNVDVILQSWAAVISKTASDFVAAFIEGAVDRAKNIENRMRDYGQKLRQFLDSYARAEMLFPESEVLDLLKRPGELLHSEDEESRKLIQVLIINALDLLYFWMYQPRAQTAYKNFLRNLSAEERHVFIQSQDVLEMQREISQMFIDGILGKNFSKPLAFYLDRSGQYLKHIHRFHNN